MENQIMVSVLCTTYNHTKTVKQCLDSLVCQKTDFKYEIIIHDDASTDGTADIIKEYAEKYPNLIKTIIQKENQYSKGIKISSLIYPFTSGKYFAYCEGDDFWCDELKLQKQFDAMEANPNCGMCVHTVKWLDNDLNELNIQSPNFELKEGIVSGLTVISLLHKYPFHTTSYFIRKAPFLELTQKYKDLCNLCPVGDVKMMSIMASQFDFYYIKETMSCYRYCSPGSWSENIKSDKKYKIKHYEKVIHYFKKYKEYLISISRPDDYIAAVDKIIKYNQFIYSYVSDDYKSLFSKQFKNQFNDFFSKKEKFFLFLKAYFPRTLKLYDTVRRKKK